METHFVLTCFLSIFTPILCQWFCALKQLTTLSVQFTPIVLWTLIMAVHAVVISYCIAFVVVFVFGSPKMLFTELVCVSLCAFSRKRQCYFSFSTFLFIHSFNTVFYPLLNEYSWTLSFIFSLSQLFFFNLRKLFPFFTISFILFFSCECNVSTKFVCRCCCLLSFSWRVCMYAIAIVFRSFCDCTQTYLK